MVAEVVLVVFDVAERTLRASDRPGLGVDGPPEAASSRRIAQHRHPRLSDFLDRPGVGHDFLI